METRQTFKKTVSELKDALTQAQIPIDSLVLYGSAARGEYKGIDSDIDILVLADDEAKSTYNKIRTLFTDIDLRNETFTSIAYFSHHSFESNLQRGSPFASEILKEGIVLYDNGTFEGLRRSIH